MKNSNNEIKAWLYEPDEQGPRDEKGFKNRYVLGEGEIDLSKLEKVLVCIGLNTSTAKPRDLDPTLKRVQGFARRKGYKNWIMLNLYPQGATKPTNMHKSDEFDKNPYLHKKNLEHINKIFKALHNPTILAAWGNGIDDPKRTYLKDNLKDIVKKIKKTKNAKAKWRKIGELTRKGHPQHKRHPRHPLMASYELGFTYFDIDDYINKL